MGVQVVSTTTASTASVVRLRAAVAVSDIAASATYQVPVSQIQYVDLSLNAVLDTRGFFKLLPEVVILLDVAAKTINKPVAAEAFTVADIGAVSLHKATADLVVSDDVFTYLLTAVRRFQSEIAPADAAAISFVLAPVLDDVIADELAAFALEKFIADGVAMTDDAEAVDGLVYEWAKSVTNMTFVADASFRTVGKNFADTAAPLDAASRGFGKQLADTLQLSDAFVRAVSKELLDSASLADTPAITNSKLLLSSAFLQDATALGITVPKFDSASLADLAARAFAKASADSVSAPDAAARTVAKGLFDGVTAPDTDFWSFNASRVESVSVPDSGFLRAQNYCDPTYFAEDYVGVSQSF